MLREFVPTLHLSTEARTIEGLLDELEDRYPRLRSKIRDESGAIRRFVRVFVDGRTIPPDALGTSIAEARTVDILHSVAGG
jgi:sulfur-carrier protein